MDKRIREAFVELKSKVKETLRISPPDYVQSRVEPLLHSYGLIEKLIGDPVPRLTPAGQRFLSAALISGRMGETMDRVRHAMMIFAIYYDLPVLGENTN